MSEEISSILTVTVPRADNGLLVTLDELKTEINETGTDKDDYYTTVLTRSTSALEAFCNRVFAVETVSESIRLATGACWPTGLPLGRYPVTEITSVEIDGEALDPEEYEADSGDKYGRLYRLSDDSRTSWSGSKIVVVYSAGYETTPGPVENGIFELVKQAQAARTRDPALRSESVLSGLYSYTLFNGENLKSVLESVTGLDRYMNFARVG